MLFFSDEKTGDLLKAWLLFM
ncbi:hypothetical protein LINGRAHAP2_LOCUS11723 [Linum grandiflorum]